MLTLITPFRTYTAALLGLLLAASIAALMHDDEQPAPVTTVELMPPLDFPDTFTLDTRATWSTPKVTAGCWFFSGPAPYGRDHSYGGAARMDVTGFNTDRDAGGTITLTFGSARFTGPLVNGGSTLSLQRDGGSVADGWLTTETLIGGEVDGRKLQAEYHYTECQLDADGSCHDTGRGDCRIDATVTLDAPQAR